MATGRALVNGRIYTMRTPESVAQAIAWRDGRILATGSTAQIQELAAQEGLGVTDLEGRVVLPGFVDAHTHFLHVGIKRTRPDLSGCRSLDELRSRTKAWLEANPGTEPVIAEGWDEADWRGEAPTREDADQVSRTAPDGQGGTTHRPLVLRRMCGHKSVANSTALPLVLARWDDPKLVSQETGVLLEQPSLYLNEVMPVPDDQLDAAIEAACAVAHTLGVTTLGDYSQEPYRRALVRAAQEGSLSVRVASSIYVQFLETAITEGFRTGTPSGDRPGGPWLRDGGLKVFHDGSFGGHTALLRKPYQDRPHTCGTAIWSDAEIRKWFTMAHAAGIQLHAHAIGDGAIDQALAGFESLADLAGTRALRHRIEHYELPHDEAVEQTAELGVVASCQPNFVGVWSSKGGMYEERLGPLFALNNRYKTFLSHGVRLAFGSDGMPFGPLTGLAAAVNHPVIQERLSIEQAIWHYTREAAWSLHWEDVVGTLEPGKCADLLVLQTKDIQDDPLGWVFEETIIAGKTVCQGSSPVVAA